MDTCSCDTKTLTVAVLRELMVGNPSLNDLAFKFGKHRRREIAEILKTLENKEDE